jgi:hypothetical protein
MKWGGQNFSPRNLRRGLSVRAEFPLIFRTEIKFRYDFWSSAKIPPEIRTKLKRTRTISTKYQVQLLLSTSIDENYCFNVVIFRISDIELFLRIELRFFNKQ